RVQPDSGRDSLDGTGAPERPLAAWTRGLRLGRRVRRIKNRGADDLVAADPRWSSRPAWFPPVPVYRLPVVAAGRLRAVDELERRAVGGIGAVRVVAAVDHPTRVRDRRVGDPSSGQPDHDRNGHSPTRTPGR